MDYETKHFTLPLNLFYFIFSTWGSFLIFTPPMDFSGPPDRPRMDPSSGQIDPGRTLWTFLSELMKTLLSFLNVCLNWFFQQKLIDTLLVSCGIWNSLIEASFVFSFSLSFFCIYYQDENHKDKAQFELKFKRNDRFWTFIMKSHWTNKQIFRFVSNTNKQDECKTS